MKPIDYRNITWEGIQNHIHNDREAVLHSLREYGPCTTRSLASMMNMDILTVRPRVTELLQLGFVEVWEGEPPCEPTYMGSDGASPSRREGIYRALSDEEAFEAFRQRKSSPNYQPQLL